MTIFVHPANNNQPLVLAFLRHARVQIQEKTAFSLVFEHLHDVKRGTFINTLYKI